MTTPTDERRSYTFYVMDPPTPMGRKRARATTKGGVTFYPEQKDVRARHAIRKAWLDNFSHVPLIPVDTPVQVTIWSYISLAKTVSRKRRLEMYGKPYVVKRPDVNNIAAQVFDALSKYAYHDDRQVTCLHTMKFPAINKDGDDVPPRLLISIEVL